MRLLFSIGCLVLLLPASVRAECVDWPKLMAQQAVAKLPANATLIAIEPFVDDTEIPGDDWLSFGIAHLLQKYLSTPGDAQAIPDELTSGLSKSRQPKYRVGGKFQHLGNALRVFVQLKSPQNKLLAQFPIEVPYPYNKQFFVSFRQAAEEILRKANVVDINTERLRLVQNATDSVMAYSNFSRGREIFYGYRPEKMEAALVWFLEAKNQDVHYRDAYLGMSDLHAFLALHHKASRQPFGLDIQKAQEALNQMKRFSKLADPDILATPSFGARVLNAQVSFISALHAAEQKQWDIAAEQMEQTLAITPEDGVATFHLANVYDKLGRSKRAETMRRKARELNSCL